MTKSSDQSEAVNVFKEHAFIRVPVEVVGSIVEHMRSIGQIEAAERVENLAKYYTDPQMNALRLKWLKLADDKVAEDGRIEFDSDATISESSAGCYVLGWVWVEALQDTGEEPYYCQNCHYRGKEFEFWCDVPGVEYACPECGLSTQVFPEDDSLS